MWPFLDRSRPTVWPIDERWGIQHGKEKELFGCHGGGADPGRGGAAACDHGVQARQSNHFGQTQQVSPGVETRYFLMQTEGLTWGGHWSGVHDDRRIED